MPGAAWVEVDYLIDQQANLVENEIITDSLGATNLRVNRATSSNGPFSLLGTVVANPGLGALFEDTNVKVNQGYYYEVQPFNAFGNGPTTEPVSALYQTVGSNFTLQNLSVTPIPGGLRGTWSHTPGASDYGVTVTRVSDGAVMYQADVTEPDLTLYLDPSASYTFSVLPGGSYVGNDFGASITATPGNGGALFVVGQNAPLRTGDQALVYELEGLGFNVTIKTSAQLATSDANGQALVVVSSSAVPSELGTKLTSVAVPLINLGAFALGQLGLTGAVSGTSFGVFGNQDSFVIDSSHELAAGGPRQTVMSSRLGNYGWGLPGSAAIGIARLPGAQLVTGAARRAEFAYDAGAALASGSAAPARRVAFLTDANSLPGVSSDGKNLLEAAIHWAIDPAASDPPVPTGLSVAQSGSNVVAALDSRPARDELRRLSRRYGVQSAQSRSGACAHR